MQLHILKTVNPYFEQAWLDNKTFEVRKNDRNFQIHDIVQLKYYNPLNPNSDLKVANELKDHWNDHYLLGQIKYILDDPVYCKEGYVIFSLEILGRGSEGKEMF
jgi:hypothetical protein